jgi:hypothetical protein
LKNLILLLLSFLSLLSSVSIFSQGMNYKRTFWFYAQRSHPFDSIPAGAMQNALSEKNSILSSGYYLNPAASNWTSIGPNYIWNGGRINFVKFADENTIIIGAPHGGLWKTTDNATWVNMDPNNELASNHSGSIAIDNTSGEETIIYYGTGEGIYGFDYAYFGLGIYKTTNWGSNWEAINNGINTGNLLKVFRITIRPGEPNHIFAATNQGRYNNG